MKIWEDNFEGEVAFDIWKVILKMVSLLLGKKNYF